MSAIAAFHVTPGPWARAAARLVTAAMALGALAANAIEVSASSTPHFDNVGGATHASRLDVLLLPPQRAALGVALGINSLSGQTGAFGPGAAALPSLDLGVHWRYTLDRSYRVDVTAYRRVQNSDAISLVESREPSYGARVEMGLASSHMHKGFVADRGFVGFQLESGARLTVKRSGGVPMLYYRNQF